MRPGSKGCEGGGEAAIADSFFQLTRGRRAKAVTFQAGARSPSRDVHSIGAWTRLLPTAEPDAETVDGAGAGSAGRR